MSGMVNFPDRPSVPADHPALVTDQLRLAAAAHLALHRVLSADTESDLCCHLSWCAGRSLDPLAGRREEAGKWDNGG